MAYTVIIEKRAEEEITEASRWIAEDSPERAVLWHFEIEEAIFSLENNPRRCPVAPENNLFSYEVRQLIFQQYRILFTIQDEEVHVLRVWHGRRDYARPDVEE